MAVTPIKQAEHGDNVPTTLEIIQGRRDSLRTQLQQIRQQRQTHLSEADRLRSMVDAHEGAIQVLDSLLADLSESPSTGDKENTDG